MSHENITKFYYYDIEDINGQKNYYNIYCYIEYQYIYFREI